MNKYRLPMSAVLTLVLLGLPVSNLARALGLFVVWFLLLRPFTKSEILVFCMVNANYVFMDHLAIAKNWFLFTRPDFFLIPWWEFIMWGYFAICAKRLTPSLSRITPLGVGLALAFALCFSILNDQIWLSAVSSLLVAFMIFFFRPLSFKLGLFAFFYGFVFEEIGILSGQWKYSMDIGRMPMPVWGFSMWIGSFIIFSCVLFPLVEKFFLRVFMKSR